MRIKVHYITLVLPLLAACGPTPEKAKAYNNKLVHVQEKAYYLNDEIDQLFVGEVWYYAPDDPQVADFISSSRARYEELIAEAEEIDDLAGHNEMKTALLDLLNYFAGSMDTYYMELIKDAAEETGRAPGIQEAFNGGFSERETAFLDAQQALAEEFNLELGYRETIKH